MAEQKSDYAETSLGATDVFLLSEKQYVEKTLRVGVETFMNRLKVHSSLNKGIISEEDVTRLFSQYNVIYVANSDLLDKLMAARMDRNSELRDKLGDIVSKFAPFLKTYQEYIVQKSGILAHLDKLTKSNKKFAEFLQINEACVQRTLKSLLEEPVLRLPQYLQEIGAIFVAWDKESVSSGSDAGKTDLFAAIVNIKKVTDEIADRIKNRKARKLVGHLQKRIFNNKISLIASHRYIVTHGMLKILVKKNLETKHFVLCNDILLLVKPMKNPSGKALTDVFPLIGMKIKDNPQIPPNLQGKAQFVFGIQALLTSEIKQVFVCCENAQEMENWTEIIKETVDEEEHSLRPCNPIDLMKRLRKEKTSKDGAPQTLVVTDPTRVKEINEWKKWKASGSKKARRRLTNLKPSQSPHQSPYSPTPPSGYGAGSPPSYNSPPSHHAPPPSQPGPPPSRWSRPPQMGGMAGAGGPPAPSQPGPPPPGPSHAAPSRAAHSAAHPRFSKSFGGPPRPNRPPPSPAQAQQQLQRKSPQMGSAPKPPAFNAPPTNLGGGGWGGPPSKPSPGPPRFHNSFGSGSSSVGGGGMPPPSPPGPGGPPPPPGMGGGAGAQSHGPPKKVPSKRAGLLGAISNFDRSAALNRVDHDEIERQRTDSMNGSGGAKDVGNLLVDTLANYRQFVMDDDDDGNDDDEDWE